MKKVVLFVTICFFITTNAFAGGFLTGTQGAKAMGMGHAFVGQASDASAIYFNAAGLTNLDGINIMAGTTLISPTVDFTGPAPLTLKTTTIAKTFTPINVYGTYKVNDDLALGIGVYNPYGLGSKWSSDWVGRALAVETELKTFYINPTVAYQVTDDLSVGAGFVVVVSDIFMSRRITSVPNVPVPTNILMELDGTGNTAYTFNFGILYKATECLSFGLSYRHSAKIEFDGTVNFSDLSIGIPDVDPILAGVFKSSNGKATMTMPFDLRAGISFKATDDLTLNADFQYVGWKSYEELAATFDNPMFNMSVPKDWKNSATFRLGGEYTFDALAVRAGYVFDGSPIPTNTMDPSLPGKDRHEFNFGLGYQITSNIRVDAAYAYISFDVDVKDSSIPLNGNYKNSTNLFGFNVGFAF